MYYCNVKYCDALLTRDNFKTIQQILKYYQERYKDVPNLITFRGVVKFLLEKKRTELLEFHHYLNLFRFIDHEVDMYIKSNQEDQKRLIEEIKHEIDKDEVRNFIEKTTELKYLTQTSESEYSTQTSESEYSTQTSESEYSTQTSESEYSQC